MRKKVLLIYRDDGLKELIYIRYIGSTKYTLFFYCGREERIKSIRIEALGFEKIKKIIRFEVMILVIFIKFV